MEEEMKIMKRIVDTVQKSWDGLSPASKTWVKKYLDGLSVNTPKRSDAEKERT